MLVTAAIVAGLFALWKWQQATLRDDGFTTGYLLFVAVLFLAAYSLRKKIPIIPLGSASTWFQTHIYVGLASVFVFLMHIGFRWPNGVFETALAGAYATVAGSGIFGLYLTRSIPRKLTKLPKEYIFERIPMYRSRVSVDARDVVLATAGPTKSNVVARFYADELLAFFESPRGIWFHLFPGSSQRRRIMRKLSNVQRYCSEEERSASEKLFQLIREKDDLDYHYAMQLILRSWLFFHVGLTYSLLILAFLHIAMVHSFHGAM